MDRLTHIPAPPPLLPAGLPSGNYENSAPKDVQENFSRGASLGPTLMKEGEAFCFMLTSISLLEEDPFPIKFNRLKAQNTKYYRDLERLKKAASQEEDDDDGKFDEEGNYVIKDPEQAMFDSMRKQRSKSSEAIFHGIAPEGHTVCLHIPSFRPYFYLKLGYPWSAEKIRRLVFGLERKCVLDPGSIKWEQVERKELFCFLSTDDAPADPCTWTFLRLSFPNLAVHNIASGKCRYPLEIRGITETRVAFSVEEVFRDPVSQAQRFMDDLDLKPESWVYIEGGRWRKQDKDNTISTCRYEIVSNEKYLKPLGGDISHPLVEDPDNPAPILIDSYDIECYCHPSRDFPDADEVEDVAYVVCHSFAWFGTVPPALKEKGVELEKVFLRVAQVIGSCAPLDGCIVEECRDETQLLCRFRDWATVIMDADLLHAYNGDKFDVPYLFKRAQLMDEKKCKRFFYMSRIVDHTVSLVKKKLSSGFLGDQELSLIKPEGRRTFDLFQYLNGQSSMRLDSYGLDAVAERFLGDKKHPIAPKDINAAWGSSDGDVHKVVAYCCQDCDLPVRLMEKLKIFILIIEMCRVTLTPWQVINTSGQQIKVFNQLMHFCHRQGLVLNRIGDKTYAATEKYQGGTVIDPSPGWHTDPVATLDFASLYPTIMMAHNLCYSTFVPDCNYSKLVRKYGIPTETKERDYTTLDFGNGLILREFSTNGRIHRFVQNGKGICPMILRTLGQRRKIAKKAMAQAPNDLVRAIMNGRQLSIKVSMNSLYGFTGVRVGKYPCQAIAETVTVTGGRMITHCRDCMESWYPGTKVIYGDSVIGKTPLLLRMDGKVTIRYIENLGGVWVPIHGGKEACELEGVESWTEDGWTPVERVIRHKYEGQLVHVSTGKGGVICTQDHSLVRKNGLPVQPSKARGVDLLHSLPKLSGKEECPEFPTQDSLLSSSPQERRAYLEKINGRSLESFYHQTDGGSFALLLVVLLESLGYEVQSVLKGSYFSISTKETYILQTQVEDVDMKVDFVYDLTTANHHFHAGVGALIVHNTDSVMVKFSKDHASNAIEAFKVAEVASERLTKEFSNPIMMEMEKVYRPYLLVGRKMYAGRKFEAIKEIESFDDVGKGGSLDIKGIGSVRRDRCHFVRNLCNEVIDNLFKKGKEMENLNDAVEIVRRRIGDLCGDRISLEDLTISGKMRASYASSMAIPPHVAVGKRFHYYSGDRVPFVISDKPEMDRVEDADDDSKKFILSKGMKMRMTKADVARISKKKRKTTSKTIPLSAYARHPTEMEEKEKGYKLNKVYYIEKQLYNVLDTLFVDRWDDVSKILKDAIRDEIGKKKGLRKITAVFLPKSKEPVVEKKPIETPLFGVIPENILSKPPYVSKPKPKQKKLKTQSIGKFFK